MKILMLTDFFPPVIGGLERHVELLSAEYSVRGHTVSVATLAGAEPAGRQERGGVRVHRLAGWSKALTPLYADASRPFHPTAPDPGIVKALRGVIRAERPDVVECHSWIMHSYLATEEAARIPTVVYLHDYGAFCANKTLVRDERICDGPAPVKCIACAAANYGRPKGVLLAAGLMRARRHHHKVDRWVAGSGFVARTAARALDLPDGTVSLVPSFVPGVDAGQPTHRPEFLPARPYVLFVGALGNHKGLDVLLEAFAPLAGRAELVLIGTPQVDTPKTLPDGVRMLENIPHDDVMAAWTHATLGVAPSSWPEPFGMVAVEAMAAGTPIVASAIGGLTDIVADGETGLLVAPRDAAALRAALTRLLDDHALRKRLGAAGPARARAFSLDAAASAMERIHAELAPNLTTAARAPALAGCC